MQSAGIQAGKEKAKNGIVYFARFGYAAKGVVYCIIGWLAIQSALGNRSSSGGKTEVFKWIYEKPLGQVLLAIVAIGLLGYMMWRLIQAIKNTENKDNDFKGIVQRLGYAGSGLLYGALAVYAGKLILQNGNSGGNGGSGSSSNEFFVSKLLEQPLGQWLTGIVAAVIIVRGLVQAYRGISGRFMKNVENYNWGNNEQKVYKRAGTIGYIARGVVLVIIGYFFFRAAVEANPEKAAGTSQAFSFLQNGPLGAWLLGAVALGVVC